MKRSVTLVLATVLAAASMNALAARPTSVAFQGKSATEDGTPFANYSVKCSNGKRKPLTAWDNRRKWCVGEGTENCHRKQIKAAKAACKAS